MKLDFLVEYMPPGSLPFIERWTENQKLIVKLRSSRKTKLGDYRFDNKEGIHYITVNRELNPESFLFVLTHEIAHLRTRNLYGPRVKSHGNEWKSVFGEMLQFSADLYSEEIKPLIIKHSVNPRASMGADKHLFQKMILEENQIDRLLENLDDKQIFRLGKRIFQRGEKRKIRYICRELKTGKRYLISGQAIVDEIIIE